MISKDEPAGIIYDKMTAMLLTSWPYTSVCTLCVSGKQPTQAADFSTWSESTKIKYGINEFQGQLIEHMTGDKSKTQQEEDMLTLWLCATGTCPSVW